MLADAISRACFSSFTRIPGARLVDADGVFGVLTNVPLTFFSGIATTSADAAIARTIDLFRSQRCPFRWWISPSAPRDLAAVLQSHGLRHAYDATAMTADLTALDLDAPLPPGLSIATEMEMEPWASVFVAVFGRPAAEAAVWLDAYAACGPEWTHFVAMLDEVPVATTSLLMAGELAGIYHVATLPHARGRGIGAAITTAALRHARAAGATTAVLQSSEMGFNVYRSIGFAPAGALSLYDWRPD